MDAEHLVLFISLGLFVGTLGTLIGAGGGFILMPVLLFLYPDRDPNLLSSLSLAVVFLNALSGSVAYMRMKKIDYRSGLIFAAATIPGALIGAYSTNFIPRNIFDYIFGTLLIIVSVYLFFRSRKNAVVKKHGSGSTHRTLTDAQGHTYTYSFNITTGIVVSIFVGYLSSMLGIGGGIIHVPVLVNLLNFPVHIATATSHFTLVIMAFAGVVEHIIEGNLNGQYQDVFLLGIGVIIGAQAGAKLSKRLHGNWIIRGLALALFSVGVRIFISAIN